VDRREIVKTSEVEKMMTWVIVYIIGFVISGIVFGVNSSVDLKKENDLIQRAAVVGFLCVIWPIGFVIISGFMAVFVPGIIFVGLGQKIKSKRQPKTTLHDLVETKKVK
jgi:hypothetical protein